MGNRTLNLLFVCSENKLRSPTGEAVFSGCDGINAISAGTNADAETPVTGDLIEWADVILTMEKPHRKKITSKFSPLLRNKRLVCLDIPDKYEYMQPELIRILEARVKRIVEI